MPHLVLFPGLGKQEAYSSKGYSLDLVWQPDYNMYWNSLGCLHSLVSVNINGKLPNLPAAWAETRSFPLLQSLDLSQSTLQGSLPPEWGQPQAFLSLMLLNASFTQLTGPLPSAWGSPDAFLKLTNLSLVHTDITGGLPDTWATPGAWPQLVALQVDQTQISGSLPASWGSPTAWQKLVNLEVLETNLSGSLPSSWGVPGAFPALQYMGLAGTNLTGSLPDSWAAPGSFPDLSLLDLSGALVSGTIPAAWGAATAFPSLLFLYLNHTQLAGNLPTFNNLQLSLLIASSSSFSGSLDAFWGSAAPLMASLLAGNNISGDLPGNASALPNLAFLDVSGNQVQGSVPDSWLSQGELLSHVIGLNVGQAWWAAAQHDSNWVSDLCLQPQLYKADVQSQPLSRVQNLLGDVFSTPGFQGAVGDRYAATSATFEDFYTQLSTIKQICSNDDAPKLLLIMWLSFATATSLLFVLYEGLRVYRRTKAGALQAKQAQQALSGSWQVSTMVRSVSQGANVLHEGFWGLAELTMYYYDLISAIIVLSQVWGRWPGYVLFAIFLVHFALTGAIVLYHGLKVYLGTWQSPPNHGAKFAGMILASVVLSPIMIPAVWLLDMIVLYTELRHFFVKHVLAHCCKHRQSSMFTRWPSSNGKDWSVLTCLKLSWLDLEYYESMHTLVAAFYQTMPTIVLNSIIFRLGNKPSHGEFFSRSLFVSCMIAAYLAMFKTLITIFWHAYFKGPHAFWYTGQVMVGRYLIRQQNLTGPGRISSGTLQLNAATVKSAQLHSSRTPVRSSSTQMMLYQNSARSSLDDPTTSSSDPSHLQGSPSPGAAVQRGLSCNSLGLQGFPGHDPHQLKSGLWEPAAGLTSQGRLPNQSSRVLQQSPSVDSFGEEVIRWDELR
ncbi:TPA: hypothetical protein ACH3X1_000627 [Trebouxia sp. C0004]